MSKSWISRHQEIENAVLATAGGELSHVAGEVQGAKATAETTAYIAADLSRLGESLGVGGLQHVAFSGKGGGSLALLGEGEVLALRFGKGVKPGKLAEQVGAEGWSDLREEDEESIPLSSDDVIVDEDDAPQEERSESPVGAPAVQITDFPDSADGLLALPVKHKEGSEAWIEAYQRRLRVAFSHGRFQRSKVIGESLADALEAGVGGELGQARIVRQTLRTLIAGVRGLLAGHEEQLSGIRALSQAVYVPPSLRWIAAFWAAQGALTLGHLEEAQRAADLALDLGRRLRDEDTLAMSRCVRASVAIEEGEPRKAIELAMQCRSVFRSSEHRCGLARSLYVEASAYRALKQYDRAIAALGRAMETMPSWRAPRVLLALLAVDSQQVDRVLRMLREAGRDEQCCSSTRLLEGLKDGRLSPDDIRAYISVRDSTLSEESLGKLRTLVGRAPDHADLRVTWAWSLYMAGRSREAKQEFLGLHAQRLPDDLRGSIDHALKLLSEEGPVVAQRPPTDALGPCGARSAKGSQDPGAFSGELTTFSIPDLLEFFRSGRRSGTLYCRSDQEVVALDLADGWITGVAASSRQLGRLLVEKGTISQEALDKALRIPGAANCERELSEVLVKSELVTVAQLEATIADYVHHTIRYLVDWREGQFSFDSKLPEIGCQVQVRLDPQVVMLEVFKAMDEEARDKELMGARE